MLYFIVITTLALGVAFGCYLSKKRFDSYLNEFALVSTNNVFNSEKLQCEIDRIEELKGNLRIIKENVDNLAIPTPERVSSDDNVQTSLNKLSRFFEEHSSATVGTEQMILALIPSSQLGESLHSLAQIVPHDVGHAIFGDAFSALKDGVSSIGTTEFLHKFVEGTSHLSDMSIISMRKAIAHHDILGACLTKVKSGVMEALGVNDATHNLVDSLKDVSHEMMSSAATNVDVSDLANAADIDITGHIPVITIALSSFREFQLLSDDKTDHITSLKNITLDAAGSGGGALVVGKIGAGVGSFFGPIGTVVGGVGGTIAGAIGGRKITNSIKRRPLKKAIKEYENQYVRMKSETESESRITAQNIQKHAKNKRDEFHNSPFLEDVPITDSNQTLSQIALILYQFVVNELVIMKAKTSKLRKSIWYSAGKNDSIINSIEDEICELEAQLPPVDYVKKTPEKTIETLLNLNMPNRKTVKAYQDKIDECREELKKLNDKNNSAILTWSYMVNNIYQTTLNDIADYSNEQMNSLNKLFNKWKTKMSEIENRIYKEKGKLGLT